MYHDLWKHRTIRLIVSVQEAGLFVSVFQNFEHLKLRTADPTNGFNRLGALLSFAVSSLCLA